MTQKFSQSVGRSVSPSPASAGVPLEAFNRHKKLLFSIAYRMLGSVADAEDKVQETFVRWQQSAVSEVRSPRAFLVTVISRLCLQHLQSALAQREEYVGPWLPEPLWTDDAPDPLELSHVQESVRVAFLLLLQKLTPAERAAFLLRDVFDYEYAEVAEILEKSEANCRQILRRARQQIKQGRPRFDPSPEQHKRLLEGFLAATSAGNLEQLLALLSRDATLYSDGGGKANAALNPISGCERVARFLLGAMKKSVPREVLIQFQQINGQPAVVFSLLDGTPGCVIALDVTAARVKNIYIVTNPDKLRHLPRMTV